MVLVLIAAGIVFVPLTIEFILDGKALRANEEEIRLLNRIDEIERKYDVEITESSLYMPKEDK